MKKSLLILAAPLLVFFAAFPVRADDAKPLYENNFEHIEAGKVPDDFLVINGDFAVKEDSGNKILELPGSPLDTFNLVFGPTVKTDIAVTARVRGTKKGRRFPTFGIGLDGQGGYRLQVSPGKDALEIFKGDDSVATVPYVWKSGEWVWLRLQILKTGDSWKLEGKAWLPGETEPSPATISFEDKKEPTAGRATIWGSPFATTPIDYDDLSVKSVTPAK